MTQTAMRASERPGPLLDAPKDAGFDAFLRHRLSGFGALPEAGGQGAGLEQLWRSGQATASDLAEAAADFYDLPRASALEIAACAPAFRDLSRRYLRDGYVYPYEAGGSISVAVADPGRLDLLKALRLAFGNALSLSVASFEEVEQLFERSSDLGETAREVSVAEVDTDAGSVDSLDTLQDLARGAPVVRMIDQILERAVEVGATDIHFETERDQLRVRLRVDGYLRRDQRLPLAMAPAIISRLKILAGLDIADRRLPQDGRANLRIGNVEADLRVAVMPTLHGETAVLRILLRDTRLLDFGRIGMGREDQASLETLLAEPHGLLIVTGPTGSGKTTTLATAISMLNDPARKIVTIEDPVEYQIAGVHQTQLKPSIGLTFATALRSFLRHDPDIIMVGEMRDQETASVGIQAALTGHLVLTTLHTNSACDAIVRLSDMGIEPYLVGASLRGVVGQRLVRRLCDRCKRPDARAAEGARALADSRFLAEAAEATYCSPQGCDACGQTGYRGRIAIFEIMRADDDLRALIRLRADPQAIVDKARSGGMSLMLEDGLRKCGRGLTSMEEVLRATG